MDDGRIIRNLRHMAWERAKGELRSMTHTFWQEEDSNYNDLTAEISRFILHIEDHGLHE